MSKHDFNTDHLNREQKKIADVIIGTIQETFGEDASGGGCTLFYTPEEWQERGEDYGTESILIVCHDGGDQAPFFNWDYCEYEMVEKMSERLREIGYSNNQCTSWYSAIYK